MNDVNYLFLVALIQTPAESVSHCLFLSLFFFHFSFSRVSLILKISRIVRIYESSTYVQKKQSAMRKSNS